MFIIFEPGLEKIVCTVYCKYANLFLCTPKKSMHPTNLCTPFSPLHIALCQLSVLGFPCFFTTHHKNCFALGNVFHVRDRKIPYTNLHQIMCYRYFT